MKKSLVVACRRVVVGALSLAAMVAFAAPLAPVDYVDKKVKAAVEEAKKYTDEHTPEIDLSEYLTKEQSNFRVDNSTNVVWRCVWSNGVEYIYAYSNNTNILNGVKK